MAYTHSTHAILKPNQTKPQQNKPTALNQPKNSLYYNII